MRTNIDIDDKLMKQAMKATGATTKKAAVEAALRQVVQLKKQAKIREAVAARSSGKAIWMRCVKAVSSIGKRIPKSRNGRTRPHENREARSGKAQAAW